MIEPLAAAVRVRLLRHARETLAAVTHGTDLPVPPTGDAFQQPSVVFVTLKCDGELRGCVGNPHEKQALIEAVGLMTRQAALEDPRFAPMAADEVQRTTIEISRLSPPVEATRHDIVLGTHGVWVKRRGREGLLLPQVALHHAVDVEEFLGLACQKAGLPELAWQDESVTITVFEAEVFGE
ncbi:MAG: AmmeMemoRadiSam system protein A [Gemmatimonadetes bacterium]|nr:AmmeMemoRadiSam system protein A [Gemmatimonadota bacterium]